MLKIKTLPHQSGIYKITNIINQHSYIGQALDIYERFNHHHIYDYKNETGSEGQKQLYQAFRKYGIENFEVSILELCPPVLLDKQERYWVNFYNTYHDGYNATEGGQEWSRKAHSIEAEEKRRQTRLLNQSLMSENHPRAKISNEEVINIRQRYKNGESVDDIWKDYQTIYNSKDVFRRIVFNKSYISVDEVISKEDIRYTNAKLTKEQVLDIRTKYYTQNYSQAKLAKEYNVTSGTICSICNRTSYTHIQDDIPDLRKRKKYRLSPEEVRSIRKEYEEGINVATLAKKYNIGETAISRCCRRLTYSDID